MGLLRPILRRAVNGKLHTVPRTLQVEEVSFAKPLMASSKGNNVALPGTCLPGATQYFPAGYVCGLDTAVQQAVSYAQEAVRVAFSFLRLSLPLTHKPFFRLPRCPRRLLFERCVLPN